MTPAFLRCSQCSKARSTCTSRPVSQAFWAVADVDQEIDDLKRRGVVFEDYDMPGERSPSGAITAGGAKAAWFKDSEGNILALVQSL